MKNNNFTPMGALHPILFFAGVYIVALVFSVFICSALFYSCNSTSTKLVQEEKSLTPQHELSASSAVVLR